MSNDLDPTEFPPDWRSTFDHEQHKIRTESGLIDFIENIVHEEVAKFREAEDWIELSPEARELRKILEKQIPHLVNTAPYPPPAEYTPVEAGAGTTEEVINGKGVFCGISAPVATTVTLFDAASGQNASTTGASPLATFNLGANATPLFQWADRGIKFRRGLFLSSTVATVISVYHRDEIPPPE